MNNEKKTKDIKDYLKNKIDIKGLEKLKCFLKIKFHIQTKKSLFLSQKKYVLNLLKEFDKLCEKLASTQIEPNKKLCLEEGKKLKDIDQCQRLIGK
jgi:hypothetical protein